MRDYARIAAGRVLEVLTTDEQPALAAFFEGHTWVDVTGAVPQPCAGWTHDGVAFAPPAPPAPVERTVLTAEEFRARFDADELDAATATAMAAPAVLRLLLLVMGGGEVDLKAPRVAAGVAALAAAGVLSASRAAEVMAPAVS